MPPARRVPGRRALAAIGVGAIVAGLLLGAFVRLAPSPEPPSPLGVARTASPSPTPTPDAPSSASPGASSAPKPAQPSTAATPPPGGVPPDISAVAKLLPIKGSALDVGFQILMAAGPDDGLYVAIPTGPGMVVTLLDGRGKQRSGWPVVVSGDDYCNLLLTASDGSVRLLCGRSDAVDGLGNRITRAYAFDEDGDPVSGWPADVSEAVMGRMVGDEMIVLSQTDQGDAPEENAPGYVHIDVVGADGAMRSGVDVAFPCCDGAFALGPEGMAILSTREWSDLGDSVKTTLVAFDEAGIRDGWPITIDGNASEVAFDPRGAAHVVVSAAYEPPSRSIVLGSDGRRLGGSGDLDIVSSLPWEGAGDPYPAAPIVASDGSAFIVSTESGGTTIMALDPSGQPRAGWPYRSKLGVQFIDRCEPDETGCGSTRTPMAIGRDDVLYLVHPASSGSAGASVVAIGPDGGIRDGWPVGLRLAGSEFWALTVNPDGGAYALAIEPDGSAHSATIVAIADDSTVRYTMTIVEP